jgi:hypothetical protein
VRFAAFLYSRKLIVNRVGSTEPREPVNEAWTPRILRGFSPHRVAERRRHHWLLRARDARCGGPLDSAAHGAPAIRSTLRDHSAFRRDIAPFVRARRIAKRSYPLLHPRSGRHAHDVGRGSTKLRSSGSRHAGDIAVKNLRIIGLAVLLLNFREVGTMHLCSTGVTG